MSKSLGPERSEDVGDGSPPLRGGDKRTRLSRGVWGSGAKPPLKKETETESRPLPWYKCKRCQKSVLSYKKCRAAHNKKCPPWRNNNVVFDSAIDSLPFGSEQDQPDHVSGKSS